MKHLLTGITLALALSGGTQAGTVSAFAENFEGTLAAWTDRNPGNPEAAIRVDPLNATNHALGFTRLGSAGSIYSTDLITTTGSFTVSFDYLGVAIADGVAGDRGGYFGISQNLPGNHQWVAGTGSYATPVALIDDGAWHHYSLTFTSQVGQAVHLMFEDWDGSRGVAGDALFDNIQFNDAGVAPAPLTNAVPEPASLGLLGLALAAAGLATARRRKAGLAA